MRKSREVIKMGIIIDEELAKKSICNCHQINGTEEPEDLMCWQSGVIGALSKSQIRELCKDKTVQTGNEVKKRVQRFRMASKKCKLETQQLPEGERLLPRIECMRQELKKPKP